MTKVRLCCTIRVIRSHFSRWNKYFFWCPNQVFMGWNDILRKNKELLLQYFAWNVKESTTCSLKWLNELHHEIPSQLFIRFTLGITLGCTGVKVSCRIWKLRLLWQKENRNQIISKSDVLKMCLPRTFTNPKNLNIVSNDWV